MTRPRLCPFCNQPPMVTDIDNDHVIACINDECMVRPLLGDSDLSMDELVGIWNAKQDADAGQSGA